MMAVDLIALKHHSVIIELLGGNPKAVALRLFVISNAPKMVIRVETHHAV